MATPTQPEKLVYLQNDVFKRKEMTEGIQYYSDNSFDTFAFPSTNGNYVSPRLTMCTHGPSLVKISLPWITRISKIAMDNRLPFQPMELFPSSRITRRSERSICQSDQSARKWFFHSHD